MNFLDNIFRNNKEQNYKIVNVIYGYYKIINSIYKKLHLKKNEADMTLN